MSIATPKVPGGIAATFTILLGQLGLPLESVGILMAANVFVCNVNTAFGALVRFTELCTFAKSEHAIDEERLRAAG
jgi:Na+/H+-dicarboxylate symporter